VPESPVTARPRERASQDKPTSAGQPASGEDDGPGAQSVRPEPTSKDEKAVESLTPPLRISEDEKARLDFLCELIDRVRTSDKEIAAFLEQTVPLSVSDQLVEIGLEKGHIFEKQITAQATQDLLRKALDDARGPHVKLKVTVASPDATPDRTASAERVRQRRAREILAIEEVKNHPRVREAVEIFRAEIKNVHIPDLN